MTINKYKNRLCKYSSFQLTLNQTFEGFFWGGTSGTSSHVSTFLSIVSQYQVLIRDVSGSANIPSDLKVAITQTVMSQIVKSAVLSLD